MDDVRQLWKKREVLHQSFQQGLFGGKINIQTALGNTGLGRNLVHRRFGKAALGKNPQRCIENLRAASGCMLSSLRGRNSGHFFSALPTDTDIPAQSLVELN